tara:strand:+ start:656 stop:1756 length:1101 start_codon:yes stop_codon:yes gene_type:complete
MLFDIIKKGINIVTPKKKINSDPYHQIRGELEIWATRDGEIFHHDKGPNTVTIWAKHANMHLLTGEVFSNKGESRTEGTHNGDSNSDGTVVSAKQYMTGDSLAWWAVDDTGVASMSYGYFPCKMLFGTGKEFENWAAMTGAEQTYYATAAGGSWTNSDFDSNIGDVDNTYSNVFSGDSVKQRKSINDMYAATLVTPVITDSDFGVTGAIKHSMYENEGDSSTSLEVVSGNLFAKNTFKGVGKPCFVYAKRDSRFHQSGTEVGLSFDSNIENKITYTVTMPEQTGSNATKFYPYNGFVLKEAGLFCDSRFMLLNTQATQDSESDDSGLTEFDNYTKMSHGIMYAKRYIAPITKSHNVGITARWTLYV